MSGFKSMWMLVAAAGFVSALAVAQNTSAPATKDTAWHNEQALYLSNLKPSDGWRATASGLRYREVKPGSGPHPAPTDSVTIHYTGSFIDGAEFDSSRGGEPATFPLPRLIKGWQEGVPLMAVGSTYEFAIPWSLGYGPVGKGPIPGGATLLFTIELIGIGEPTSE